MAGRHERAERAVDAESEGTQMDIQVNSDNNIHGREALVDDVAGHVESRLERFAERITRVEVHLGDENAAKPGDADIRCLIEVRVGGRAPVTATDYSGTVDAAVAGATRKVSRALDSELGRLDRRKGGDSIRGGERA